jgi:RNA polymerase sigma-70 factor, ECF subfamily
LSTRKSWLSALFGPSGGSVPLQTATGFATRYEQNHLPVFRYLYGLTGGPQQDAEDLTAETFIRAWRARRSFQGDADAMLAWLMKIGRRLVIDDYRRRSVRPQMEEEIPPEQPAGQPSPEETLLVRDDQELLWRLLGNLPEEPREMLVLRYLLGWRVNRIATYLAIPENTVSVTIHRALERLRQRWPQSEEN